MPERLDELGAGRTRPPSPDAAPTRRARRVLLTGVAGPVAGALASRLEALPHVEELVGIDVHEPVRTLRRTRFVRADIRNPLVGRVLDEARIDTVLHASTTASPRAAGGRARMKERNVIGTMQLLAACQRAEHLDRLVLRSSTAVYGSDHADPALFREDQTPRDGVRHGYGRDAVEVEGYARAFARRRPDVDVTMLRFANLVGGETAGAFGSLFSFPAVPTVLGYDPRLQFCHLDDALAVLERVVTAAHPGVFNVAGDGVLYLSQCIRLAGRVAVPVPLPFVAAVAALVQRSGRADVSADQLRFLQFGRGVDTTRLRTELGFTPVYTTRQAFQAFLEDARVERSYTRDDVLRVERELGRLLARLGGPAPAADEPVDVAGHDPQQR